jgi:hypothetical protein
MDECKDNELENPFSHSLNQPFKRPVLVVKEQQRVFFPEHHA